MFNKREGKLWQIVLTVIAVAVVLLFFRSSDDLVLDESDQVLLLDWARQQLTASANDQGLITVPFEEITNRLQRPGSAFVSFYEGGRLRGCMIDTFTLHEALYLNVIRNTALAATADQRFPPVGPDDVANIRIAISIVGTPKEVAFQDPDDLLGQLSPGLDGVILTVADSVSAYLPTVWATFPDPEEFLSQLCLKADLDRDRWRQEPYPRIETFRAFTFGESPDEGS